MRPILPLALILSIPLPAAAEPWLDRLVLGVLVHDRSPFADRNEDGFDGNVELMFRRLGPTALAPRALIGANLNLGGDTSYVYTGLGWEFDMFERWFVGGSVGLAAHNGQQKKSPAECAGDDCGFGSVMTIRLAGELGWWIDDTDAVAVFMDHISHAGWFAEQNEGIDNIGLRWHRRF